MGTEEFYEKDRLLVWTRIDMLGDNDQWSKRGGLYGRGTEKTERLTLSGSRGWGFEP